MASSTAIKVVETLLQRTDKQVRDILAVQERVVEVDTINALIGDGESVLSTGVVAAVRVDFNGRITGGFIHELDGTSGSVTVGIDKATYAVGVAPTFVSIVGSAPLTVSGARYGQNLTLVGWNEYVNRGDVLRFSVTSVSSFTRLLIALRLRRLEP